MDEIALTYHGHVFDVSGYGRAARAYVHALHAAGVNVSVVDLSKGPHQIEDPLVMSLTGRRTDTADFHIFHGIPTQWQSQAIHLDNAIAITVWETDTAPAEWTPILNRAIEVWLPCEFNVNVFRRALRASVFRLPHPLMSHQANSDVPGAEMPFKVSDADFVFYCIFEWQDWKGPCETLYAYFQAFPEDGDHLLVMKTNPGAAAAAAAVVDRLRHQTGSAARVKLAAERWSDAQIDALHARGDCYVSLHRGEGWGYPLFESAARGTSVIATAYSGPMDYLAPSGARLVPFTLGPVRQPYVYYESFMQWAEPDVDYAATLMRDAHAERDSARRGTGSFAAGLRSSFSPERVGAIAKARLLELLRDDNPQRWRDLTRGTPPPAPMPADWYDEDYSERGVKSNWSAGYSWAAFGSLFTETAAYVIEMFPQARSFLDAGCGKGFLVRALREAGRECWGFDHSPWAIDHAEPAARPFVERASVDDVRLDREVDVLLAFDLFSQLTEEQARSFLSRARQHTRMAVVAVITALKDDEDERSYHRLSQDRDRSHITRRQLGWWHALFEDSGWRLDPLHRIGAEHCQRHPLPGRMGWKIVVYAPVSGQLSKRMRSTSQDPFARIPSDHAAATLVQPVSQLVTAAQIREPNYRYWCDWIREEPRLHRKQWEYCYILEVLRQHRCLRAGSKGLGFGVGREPLPAVMAAHGCLVTATDLDSATAQRLGWTETNQHAASLDALNDRGICGLAEFHERVRAESVDMNAIPASCRGFDFLWSSCALEHLGSLHRSVAFVESSLECLRPGGIGVHTTEFNLSSNEQTVTKGPTVLFRKRDLEDLAKRLADKGHRMAPLNFETGQDVTDQHVDTPPYQSDIHLKLALESYVVSSFGFFVQARAS